MTQTLPVSLMHPPQPQAHVLKFQINVKTFLKLLFSGYKKASHSLFNLQSFLPLPL